MNRLVFDIGAFLCFLDGEIGELERSVGETMSEAE